MTPDYTRSAIYDIRSFLWSELKTAGILDENDYYADGFNTALVPIIPAQQIPEFNNNLPGRPYIVYDLVARPYGEQWWISEEIVTFTIVSRSANQIQTMMNFMTDIFRRYDKSATDLNLVLVPDSPFKFFYMFMEGSDPIEPFDNEGGFMSAPLSVQYAYSRDVDPITGRFK